MGADIVDSTMLQGSQPIRLPRSRHDRPEREHWEYARLDSMRRNLNPGDVIYDIGAEMGDMSTLYGLWGCQVVLAEPNPASWPWARATWEANDLGRPWCWWGFVSDKCTDGPDGTGLSDGWPPCANNRCEPEHGFVTEHERGAEWPSVTIDALADMVGPPDAITVDTESYELEAMVGAGRVLADHRPLVWLSVHPPFLADRGLSDVMVHGTMADAGYVGTWLASDHEEHWLFRPTETVL